jgi:hypothetical protein
MGLKKNVTRKRNYGLHGSRLLGIIRKVISANQMGSTKADFQVPEDQETRKYALDSMLQAEYWKAQAITLVRRNPYV